MFLFKRKSLLEKDEEELLDIIKKKYDNFSSLIFNNNLSHIKVDFDFFLNRYKIAQEIDINIKDFLKEELYYIDDLLVEIQKKTKPLKKKTNVYSEIAKKIHSLYAHYPKVDLGNDVPDEYCHLLGAIREFSSSFTSGIEKLGRIIKDKELKEIYYQMEYSYKLIFTEKKNSYPKEIQSALYKSRRLKNLDDIQKNWIPVYKLFFNVLMELNRFVNRVYKKDEVKGNVNFSVGNESLSFSDWRELILAEIDKLMTNFRLKGLI